MPTMIDGILGLPTTVLNFDLGASYPAKPTLQLPDPLSITMHGLSMIFIVTIFLNMNDIILYKFSFCVKIFVILIVY
jgi:hypothetical protein